MLLALLVDNVGLSVALLVDYIVSLCTGVVPVYLSYDCIDARCKRCHQTRFTGKVNHRLTCFWPDCVLYSRQPHWLIIVGWLASWLAC
jgi:hypothetical protein